MAPRTLLLLASVLVALASSGCTVQAGPPVVTGGVTVESAPIDIEAYPHVYYDNQWAYLVGNRWYHRGPSGWVVFHTEPAALYQHRVYYRQYRRFETPGPAIRHDRRDYRYDNRYDRRDERHEHRDDRRDDHRR